MKSVGMRIAIALTLILGLAGVAEAAQNARFTGRVVDLDGEPVAGVTIVLRNVDNGQVVEIKSDDNGRYFRRALTIGRYEVTYQKEGYVTARDERRLGSGQTDHDAVLERVRVNSADPSSSPEYGQAFEAFNAGDSAAVIEILTPVIEREPEFLPAHVLLARAHFELGHWSDAIEGYERVIGLNPEVAMAYLDLGVALVETGELEQAQARFEQALAMQPEDSSVHYNIGAIYVRADRVEEAVRHLTRATELDPDNSIAHKALAFALVRLRDTEGAIRHLERYLELEPDAVDAADMAALLEDLRGS